jgi:hypothetical protein
MKCQICQRDHNTLRELFCHITLKHKDITKEQYYNEYIPKTKCKLEGCDKIIDYFGATKCNGYCKHGHYQKSLKLDKTKKQYLCQICKETSFDILGMLSKHLTEKHPEVNDEKYYNDYLKTPDSANGTCLWCGKKLEFKNIAFGYYKFCYNTDCNVNYYNKQGRAIESGDAISKSLIENQNMPNQIGFWTKQGYTEYQARGFVKERQTTNSVEAIQARENCSLEEARAIRQQITDKWMHTLSLKTPEEKNEMIRLRVENAFKSLKLNSNTIYFISKKEKELGELLNIKDDQLLLMNEDGECYVYDLTLNNKIIEFNGDYWHANPIKYTSDQVISYPKGIKRTAQEVWDKDKRKIEFAKSKGYEVLTVWENDFDKSKEQIVQKCLDFLTT